jgi:hypothetical protein
MCFYCFKRTLYTVDYIKIKFQFVPPKLTFLTLIT